MKRHIYLTLALLMCACSKDEPDQVLAEDMASDPAFIAFTRIDKAIARQIRDTAAIKAIISDGNISGAEQMLISKAYGFDSQNEFLNVMQAQMDRKADINARYQLYAMDDLDRLKVLTAAIEPSYKSRKLGNEIKATCEDVKLNCFVSVAANSLALHFSCTPLDASIWAGLVCHSAVIIYNYSENNRCNYEYQYCREQLKRDIQ